jgi:hypothetical protein
MPWRPIRLLDIGDGHFLDTALIDGGEVSWKSSLSVGNFTDRVVCGH